MSDIEPVEPVVNPKPSTTKVAQLAAKIKIDLDKVNKIVAWIAEPSTLKGISTALAMAGYLIDPTKIATIIAGWGTFYSLVSMFYDKH